ncbi:MAG: 2-C-methyl-D-erythritol 4-phosphate cytidylyltransferase [Oscillospiraceae bacterium]|jgi:2-C-methyl-D-erythritol 4-phosphate cytidylyltransferase|nr:2-C-methyl-D-erythritol 4-phosphate cytidylyltransferase [Oscillospiraceae bacterium]
MSLSKLFAPQKRKIRCSAVIVAAGASSRFGGDKLFAPLNGMPVLAYSLISFEASAYITEIIVVTEAEKIESVAALCRSFDIGKASKILCGGATRLESALCGAGETDKVCDLIAIHDGARPLVTSLIINSTIEAAMTYKAAIPVVPARDTVKILDGSFVRATPDRARAFVAQTPQVFVPELIKGALTDALQKDLPIPDDACAVEQLGFSVRAVAGSEENIKLTTPLDLRFAERILESRREAQTK